MMLMTADGSPKDAVKKMVGGLVVKDVL